MTRRRAIFCLFIFCALTFSAIAAQGALAAGQTAFTCTSIASTKDFSSAHCVPGETGTSFGHVAITEETHAKISNANTNATTTGPTNTVVVEIVAGTKLEFVATGVEGLGTLNNEEVGGEMRATVTSDMNGIIWTGVHFTIPAGKGCKVFEDKGGEKGVEGVIKTKPVTLRTVVTGTTHEVLFEPVTPNVFATFFSECSPPGIPFLEGKWEITGSFKCPTHGATITCEHTAITTQNTLKAKGSRFAFEGKTTITAGKFPVTEPTNPVGFTTTTP